MRVVCVSDTHCQLRSVSVPDGDVLVHAGDATYRGNPMEIREFGIDMSRLPHKHKIFVAGNHDWLFQRNRDQAESILSEYGITYLQDSGVEVGGVSFYGSPYQPAFCNWAFNLSRFDGSLAERWSHIPGGLDFLITHGPPMGTLDLTAGFDGEPPEHVGCRELAERLEVVKPKYHVFGHIHHSYGLVTEGGTTYVNASICNERYDPVNAPVVIDL